MSGPFASVNGHRVVAGSLTVPFYGPWSGDVTLADPVALPAGASACTVEIGDLTLVGTVYRQAVFSGSTKARLVAGAGGWRKPLPAQHYQSLAGLTLSSLVNDAAIAVGETVIVAPDSIVGTDYVRAGETGHNLASDVIRELAGDAWWVDVAGVTHVGPRPTAPVVSPFQAIEWDGGAGQFTIATEDYGSWLPGAQFIGPTIPTTQTVSSCNFMVDNDGLLRLDVLTTTDASDRLISPIDAVIRASAPRLTYAQLYEYTVVSVRGAPPNVSLDVVPASDNGMPSLANIKLFPDSGGGLSVPHEGAACTVYFADGNPTKPRIANCDSPVVLAEIDANAVRIGPGATTVTVGPVPLPVSSAPATLTIIAALESVVVGIDTFNGLLATLFSAIASSTAPGPPSPSFAAFAAAVTTPATGAATGAGALSGACTAAEGVIAGATALVPTLVLEAT